KARQSPAQPEVEIKQQARFSEKNHQADHDVSIVVSACFRKTIHQRKVPAAEIERGGHGSDYNHCRVLGHEKERPTKARVFGVKAGDQLGLRFRQIEWCAVVFGNAADDEDHKTDWLIDKEPDRIG